MRGNNNVYSCNSYLVLGSWNRIEDLNALIDVGVDGSIIDEIEETATGVGKVPVERVILTHNHFDHSGGLQQIIRKYNPEVLAFANYPGVNRLLQDGEMLKIGDRNFEVIHIPGHSDDSICLYCLEDKVLFSGDTSINIMTSEGSYSPAFIKAFERILSRDIETIYPGHDEPKHGKVRSMLRATYENIIIQ